MNWPAPHRTLRVRSTWRRLMLALVVVSAMLTTLVVGVPRAQADTSGAANPCSEVNTAGFSPECLPPDLLNLSGNVSGLYTATPAQTTSLEDFELTATANTIADHDLASTDGNAVLTWARPDAQAELFALIEQAINTPTASQTQDQQNVVAWAQAVEQRQAEVAAQNAGLEYVKWAGLDPRTYSSLIDANADESNLQSFLASSPPSPYGPGGSSGYCTYQPPSPYQSDYTIPTDCAGVGDFDAFGGPPAPSYDQFVEWGEADAAYSLDDSTEFEEEGALIALGLDFAAPVVGAAVAGLALSSGLALAAVGTPLALAIFPFAGAVSTATGAIVIGDTAAAAAPLAAGAGFIAGALIFDIATAVVEGINIANEGALPGQLASLISGAATTAPAVSTLISGANGVSSLFSLFVGATLPAPLDETCDNSSPVAPSLTVLSGIITEGSAQCLNPTAIPPATSTDPQFVVQQQGGIPTSTTSSITWEDMASATTLRGRITGNWFVVQHSGSTNEVQTLSIPYTDWAGNEQMAWLVGNPTTGYQFVGYNVTAASSTPLDPSTCVADNICWASPSIDYVGPDGKDYSAEVQVPGTGNPAGTIGTVSGDNPTGFPVFGSAVEGAPVEFSANTFGPLAAFDPNHPGQLVDDMTYTWQFQDGVCNLGCLSTNGVGPTYGPVITGGVIGYRFPTSGTYAVQLTATDDANNEQAVDDFTVTVTDVPPAVAVSPATTVPVETATSLSGTISHAGTQDIENVYVDWGDGSVDSGECGLADPFSGAECAPAWTAVPGQLHFASAGTLTLTSDPSDTNIAFADTHTYAGAGTYYAAVTVTDQSGATFRRTVVETVTDPAPTIRSSAPSSALIGSSPTVTIAGSGFVPGSTIEWDGTPLTTTYVPSTVLTAGQGPTLTAQVPATDTADTTAGEITVVNAAPGGGTSNPQFLYIVPAQGSIAGATFSTSTGATGSAAASVGGSGVGTAGSLSAAASGVGTVALAQYKVDPEPTSPPTAANAYLNVSVPLSSSFTSVQVTDCDLAGGSVVYYYDDTTAQWTAVSGQAYNANTGCVTFTLATGSTPNLTQLRSTVFGVQDVPPSLTVPGDQSVAYHAPLGLSVSASDTQPNPLTLSAAGLPAGLSFTDNGNGTGTVTGTVTGAAGPYSVTFTAGDGVVATTAQMTITVTQAGTTLTYTGSSLIANNRPATLSAVLEEDGGSAPGPDGQTVTLTLGSGGNAQSCQGQATSDGWVSCQVASVNQPLGHQPVTASFGGDSYYTASATNSQQALVFSYLPAGGGFALGDQAVDSATPATTLTWSGAKWAKLNPLSGGAAPASFQGFAQTFRNGSTTVADPACGGTWTGSPGSSAVLPDSVPAYMAVVVPSKVAQSGSTISGNVAEVVIVKTNAGYQPNPADPGTGTVVATLCGS